MYIKLINLKINKWLKYNKKGILIIDRNLYYKEKVIRGENSNEEYK